MLMGWGGRVSHAILHRDPNPNPNTNHNPNHNPNPNPNNAHGGAALPCYSSS